MDIDLDYRDELGVQPRGARSHFAFVGAVQLHGIGVDQQDTRGNLV